MEKTLDESIQSDNNNKIQEKGANQKPLQIQAANPKKQGEAQNINGKAPIQIFEQKINSASEYKNEGNKYFKEKNYVVAVQKYSQGLKILDPQLFYGASLDQHKKLGEISSILLFNIGCCYFNSYDMTRAEIYFNQALIINPKYIKALHKRALSRYQLKKFDGAMEDIKLAFNLDKSNVEVHTAYSKILEKYNEEAKKQKQKLKQFTSKMLNKSERPQMSSPLKQSQKQKNNEVQQEKKEQKGRWINKIGAGFIGLLAGVEIYKNFFSP